MNAGIKKFGSLGFLADTQFFMEIRYSKIKNPNTTQTHNIHHTYHILLLNSGGAQMRAHHRSIRYLHKMSATRRTSERASYISSIQLVCRSVK